MKEFKFCLFISILFLFSESIYSQNTENIVVDTIYVEDNSQSQRGNLELLAQRIHNAFTAYVNGSTKVYQGRENPAVFQYDSIKSRNVPMSRDELKQKTFDMVESIKVIYDPKWLPVFYGTRSFYGIIEVKFIDDSKKK